MTPDWPGDTAPLPRAAHDDRLRVRLAEMVAADRNPSDVARLILPSGHVVLFDEADREIIEPYRWFAAVAARTVYARGYKDGERRAPRLRMHRLITGAPDGMDVDHRNHNGLDNRRANLRVVTHAENVRNARPRSEGRSGYKGVLWDAQRQMWHASIRINGRSRHIGRFASEWEAAQAYNAAALEAWGDFAYLNERRPS